MSSTNAAVIDDARRMWNEDGWFILPEAIDASEVRKAQAELLDVYPSEEAFAGDPEAPKHLALREDQWAGMETFPFAGLALSRLVVAEPIQSLAESLLGTETPKIYQAALWAKYGLAIDYEQRLHVDYPNHTLVAPRRDGGFGQLQLFVYLSDVSEANGATRFVSRRHTRDVPLEPSNVSRDEYPDLYDQEVAAAGSAGTVVGWSGDVFHRGVRFQDVTRSRFILMISFCAPGSDWIGYHSWPRRAHHNPDWQKFVESASPRELSLFGFPEPGHEYWDRGSIDAVAARYPGLNLEEWISRMDSSK